MGWGANQICDELNSAWTPSALTGLARVINGLQRGGAVVVVKGELCQFVVDLGVF